MDVSTISFIHFFSLLLGDRLLICIFVINLTQDLSSAEASEEVKIQQLRILVETRKRAFQEKQRQDQERERVKEERLAKIKRDQEIALKKKRDALDTVMVGLLTHCPVLCLCVLCIAVYRNFYD